MTMGLGSYVFFLRIMAGSTFGMLWRDVRPALRGLCQKRPRQSGVRDRSLGAGSFPAVVDLSCLSISEKPVMDMTT
jgi:hypothetical protein